MSSSSPQSLPHGQSHSGNQPPARHAPSVARLAGGWLVAACGAVLSLLALTACGKKETLKPTAEAPTPKAAAVSDAQVDAEVMQALADDPKKEAARRAEDLAAQAEDIIAKYPDKNAQDLLNVPEVNQALKVGLTKLSQDKALERQIAGTAAITAKMMGLEGDPKNVSVNLDLKNYDHARKSRMVQAILSEDPRRIVSFLTEEIGEATPELTLEGAERASNGVAIKENTPPSAAK